METIVFLDRLSQVRQVAQNRVTQSLREIVVQNFDNASQVLKLLNLLTPRRD